MKERMTPIWFKELDSTNNEAIRGIENYDNLSVLAARKQFAGRGQRGNRWDTEPGANLTFSIVLKFRSEGMTPLPASRQFRLSRIAALAVCDYLKAKGVESRIKWPNDIYVRDRKICGMLIENSLDGKDVDWSVIGIGINLNQKNRSGIRRGGGAGPFLFLLPAAVPGKRRPSANRLRAHPVPQRRAASIHRLRDRDGLPRHHPGHQRRCPAGRRTERRQQPDIRFQRDKLHYLKERYRMAAMAAARSSALKTELPATKISAPQRASSAALAGDTPPSTSMGIRSPRRSISAFRVRMRP